MNIPIVLSAFGTTTKAQSVYQGIDGVIRREFPGCDIRWAYSSRLVRDRLHQTGTNSAAGIQEVLASLARAGHRWAVVQSLHLINGHEFYRLLEEVRTAPLRLSMGLPLLSSTADYQRVAQALSSLQESSAAEAMVLVGHGTDHPAWSAYLTLQAFLRDVGGPHIFVGVVEGHPSQDYVVAAVRRAGLNRVRLVPLMLVAGRHYLEDLCHEEDSWQAAFHRAGCQVTVEPQGIGALPEIIGIFMDHIREAMDAIPPAAIDRDHDVYQVRGAGELRLPR